MLKSQDVMVALLLAVHPRKAWSFPLLAEMSGMSASAAFRAVERLRLAKLVVPEAFRVYDDRLLSFLEHGVPHAFPALPGRLVRGVPTAHAAPPLSEHIAAENAVVWPYAKGGARGESLAPLAPSAPEVAQRDEALYRVLALVDALRIGRPREQKLAMRLLKEALAHARVVAEAG
jgi:hypothetical protein